MAQHLPSDDPKIPPVVAVLKEVLATPSEAVQLTVSNALSPLVKKLADDEAAVTALVQHFLTAVTAAPTYGARRGAAYGLAGCVKVRTLLSLGFFCYHRHSMALSLQGAVSQAALNMHVFT